MWIVDHFASLLEHSFGPSTEIERLRTRIRTAESIPTPDAISFSASLSLFWVLAVRSLFSAHAAQDQVLAADPLLR
jgi:hypothetical protein